MVGSVGTKNRNGVESEYWYESDFPCYDIEHSFVIVYIVDEQL